MEVRYLGFEQQQNARSYQFDVAPERGQPAKRFIVTADLSLFHTHGVAIQEGPSLSAGKLVADLSTESDGAHELTAADLQSYLSARSLEEATRAAARKAPRRHPPQPRGPSPWRGVGA